MQRRKCHQFADQMGWVIVHEEQEDGVSGHKVRAENRDKIQTIKELAKQGKFDILLVFMFDRIGRIADETPFVVEWFVKNGIQVWSTQEGEQRFDNHTDTNGLYDCIKAFFSSLWRKIKAKKLSEIQSGKITENVNPTVHIQAGDLKIVLPTELEEKFKYFVDRMFECINPETIKEEKYGFYDADSGKITFLIKHQIAERAMQEWQSKHNKD